MDPGVPKEPETQSSSLQGAERAFEEHEAEMVEVLIALAERGLSENATVGEAVIEMRRAMREDPEAQELVHRLVAMILFDGGSVAMNWGRWWRENRLLE